MLGKSDFHSTSKSGPMHLHSADLFGAYSPQQIHRQSYRPHVPAAYKHQAVECFEEVCDEIEQEDPEQLAKALPQLFGTKYCEVRQAVNAAAFRRRPLRVGVVLSGGPAPGGHNVIAGLFDFLRKVHPESKLFGFMGGMDGFFNMKYKTITPEHMARFRNSGGFDMLWSGRGRVNGRKDMDKAVEVAKSLEMTGLVVVGGDGSCSNAALLANHMAEFLPSCSVVGVPKTIDGDLKNAVIESSFGFDTASKTYSELIGNLCVDVGSSKHTYHFVRVMGRSASHLVLECALQTRPNLCLVGEEIERNNTSLKEIVQEIVELIAERKKKGVNFGVLLVPEGLIEFIPEIKKLIAECNEIVKKDGAFDKEKLSDEGRGTWDFLPEVIQDQLLMEREATGYIQVAKVATERLLILLVKNQLYAEGIDQETHPEVSFMPHYFGYEGRCAMPSNFDANYCFSLGLTAGALIQNKRNGYMSLVRNLSLPTADWSAAGIPIVQLMKMYGKKGEEYPGVTKQLVDLDGPLFQVFKQARALWKYGDMYRNPGPIQFDGPVADGASYTVCIPVLEELISYDKCEESRSCFRKSQEVLSPLQLSRLRFKPEMNSLCMDQKARARQGQQFVPQDPYTLRQILLHYPQLCNHHQFAAQEVLHDKYTSPILTGLRVGVVFMSRQAPGITNILWGLFERLSIVGGSVIGFKNGLNGLLESDYIEVERTDLDTSLNQGGMEFLGRSLEHTLMNVENMERARQTCEEMRLDGLVVVGSAYTLSEATLFSEYLLQKSCSTSVIGIPATGSNNVAHELLESCLGFDSTTKVYASLIGNILTDAASMPKYWHFIRLMGRDPSHEVMECALQTHPNFVIIAEEYGAADKTLVHIVQDIADVVCRRAEAGKNFGTVLIPEGLLLHLPNMRNLMAEVNAVVKEAREKDRIKEMRDAMVNIEDGMNSETHWAQLLTPWSLALFKSFPKFIRKELVTSDAAETKLTHIETEELVAQMVKKELEKRKKHGRYSGKFAAVTHFFGYQGRSSLPSAFDCHLGLTHGYLASILVESGLTGYCTTVRGLCGASQSWKLGAIPMTAMMKVMPRTGEYSGVGMDIPLIPSAEVNLESKSFRYMKNALEHWESADRFCNPGPMQFWGEAALFYNRILHEEQAEYLLMLQHVEAYTQILHDTCRFGVEESFLRTAYSILNSLLTLRLHPDDLMAFGLPIAQENLPPALRHHASMARQRFKEHMNSQADAVDASTRARGSMGHPALAPLDSPFPGGGGEEPGSGSPPDVGPPLLIQRHPSWTKEGATAACGTVYRNAPRRQSSQVNLALQQGGPLPSAPWAVQEGALEGTREAIQGPGHSEKNTPGIFSGPAGFSENKPNKL